jgi:hypothetical protein
MIDDLIYCRNRSDFVESVLTTVQQRDSRLLDELLNVSRMSQIADLDYHHDNRTDPSLEQVLINDNDWLWKQLSHHHWSTCRYLKINDIDRAFRHQSKKFSCLISIINIYQTRMSNHFSDGNIDTDKTMETINDDGPSWLLPVINRHAYELRLLAHLSNDDGNNDDADLSDAVNSNSTIHTYISQLREAMSTLQRFSATNKLRKLGLFIINNQMLKTYYALGTFNLCTPVIQKGRPCKN